MKSKRKFLNLLILVAIGSIGFVAFPYLQTWYLGWQFEYEVKKQPLFALIAQKYPEDFAFYLVKVKKDLKQDNTDFIQDHSSQLVNKIFYQSLQHAPDDYIELYLKATLDLYHYLNGQDPRAVVKLEKGDDNIDYDLNELFQRKDFQSRLIHLLDTKRFVIAASIPSPSDSNTQAAVLLQEIQNDLSHKFSESVVKETFTGSAIPANVASQIIIEFYSNILGKGKEKAGSIMRYIASLKENEKHG